METCKSPIRGNVAMVAVVAAIVAALTGLALVGSAVLLAIRRLVDGRVDRKIGAGFLVVGMLLVVAAIRTRAAPYVRSVTIPTWPTLSTGCVGDGATVPVGQNPSQTLRGVRRLDWVSQTG